MDRTVVGIDVGTTKICTLVGEVTGENDLRVVGVGVTPSRGLRKGVVVNVKDASKAIFASVKKAERVSGYSIERAYVGVAGTHISSLNSRGVVAIGHGDRIITRDDVNRALDAARAIAVPHNQRIIHVIPRGYTIDGQSGVCDPLGLMGFRLEVETHIVTGAVTSLQNLIGCVEETGVRVNDLVLQSLASAEAVLTPEEKDMGVVLVDGGGGTTDIAIFIDGNIWHSLVLQVGGNNLTNDVAVGLRIPFSAAESVKIKHGHVILEAVEAGEYVDVIAFGEAAQQSIARRQLVEIIAARLEEIFELVSREIKRSGYDGLLPAGVVLTGGVAGTSGIAELGRRVLSLPVRVGYPMRLDGLVEAISSPEYSTSVGLLLWGMKQEVAQVGLPDTPERWSDIYRRFVNWLKVFLPG
ncbi:MAG: cell division protein FtsA [Chloroflexota bacterium]